MRCSRDHPWPGLGQSLAQRGDEGDQRGTAARGRGRARRRPRPSRRAAAAVRCRAPRRGTARRRAWRRRRRARRCRKLPAGLRSPASTGSSKTRSRLSVIAVGSSSSSRIVCAGPAAGTPSRLRCRRRGSRAAARRARRCRRSRPLHRPARRAALRASSPPARARCSAFSARIGKTQGIRLSSKPARQRAEHRPPQSCRVQRADRDAAARNLAGRGRELEAAAVAQRQHAGEVARARRACASARRPTCRRRGGTPAARHNRPGRPPAGRHRACRA